MASPTFQKGGPHSTQSRINVSQQLHSNTVESRKPIPTLVFRQKSSKPLLLNSHALGTNFAPVGGGYNNAGNKAATPYRYKYVPTIPSSNQIPHRAAAGAPAKGCKSAPNSGGSCSSSTTESSSSYTPLAQFFTFTGRLNTVRERNGNNNDVDRSKYSSNNGYATVSKSAANGIVHMYETNSYRLKLNGGGVSGNEEKNKQKQKAVIGSEEKPSKHQTSTDSVKPEAVTKETWIPPHEAERPRYVNGNDKTYHQSEGTERIDIEAERNEVLNDGNTENLLTSSVYGGKFDNSTAQSSADKSLGDCDYSAGFEDAVRERGEDGNRGGRGYAVVTNTSWSHLDPSSVNYSTPSPTTLQPRPQSAAISYALHKQVSQTKQSSPVAKRPSSSCGTPSSTVAAAATNLFLRPNPIQSSNQNQTWLSSGSNQPQNNNNLNYSNNQNQSMFYNATNSNRGISVFNSRSVLVQPRTPRYSSFKSQPLDRQSPAVSSSDSTPSVPLAKTLVDAQPHDYGITQAHFHATPGTPSSEKVSYLQRINSRESNVVVKSSADRIRPESTKRSSHDEQTNNCDNYEKSENAIEEPSQGSKKPVLLVKPMLRTVATGDDEKDAADKSATILRDQDSRDLMDDNAVVVKVVKKSGDVSGSSLPNGLKNNTVISTAPTIPPIDYDTRGGADVIVRLENKGTTEVTRKKLIKQRSTSSESAKSASNLNTSISTTFHTKHKNSKSKQQTNLCKGGSNKSGVVSGGGGGGRGRSRQPLAQLEKMHNNSNSSVLGSVMENVAHVSKERHPSEMRARSVSRSRNTNSSSVMSSNAKNTVVKSESDAAGLLKRSNSLRNPSSQSAKGAASSFHGDVSRNKANSSLSRVTDSGRGGTKDDDEDDEDGDDDDDDDECFDEYDEDGAEFLDDEMNSLDDDAVSVCSTGRLSACSSYSSLGGAADEDEEGGDEGLNKLCITPRRATSSLAAEADEHGVLPPLWPSLFKFIPPTIYFYLSTEKVAHLPPEVRKLLKWKPSTICPNVVKRLIMRVGFRWSKSSTTVGEGTNDWICYWGKHMKSECFKNVKEFQKVNHFPGTFQIGRKDRLYRNLTRLQNRYGQKHFNFFPNSYILPQDLRLLKRTWDEGGHKFKWILKPPASARGIGIKVINKWNQIPKRRAVIVQRYISRPFLINGSKFDLRIYVFVTSYDPLRIYVYNNGLARFCSMKYSNSVKNIGNKFMHLTNYSVNKFNNEYLPNDSSTKCEGHKWTLQALWSWMARRGIDHKKIWTTIQDIVVKTIISSEYCVSSATKSNLKNSRSCYELFGFDILLDDNLKPWILEVNISPSLHSNSELDVTVKESMLRDLFNILGIHVPDKEDVTNCTTTSNSTSKVPWLKEGKLIRDAQLTTNERAKHVYYMQRANDEAVKSTVLDILTAQDVRLLAESEDEMNRAGDFIRVFPSVSTSPYLKFLDQPAKYNNLLLDEWVRRYVYMPSRGVAILEQLCEMRVHLGEREDVCKWVPTLGLNVFRSLESTTGASFHRNNNQSANNNSKNNSVLSARKNNNRTISTAGGVVGGGLQHKKDLSSNS